MEICLDRADLLLQALVKIRRHRACDDLVSDRIQVAPVEIDWLPDGIERVGQKHKIAVLRSASFGVLVNRHQGKERIPQSRAEP
jgi:hypothetical protein